GDGGGARAAGPRRPAGVAAREAPAAPDAHERQRRRPRLRALLGARMSDLESASQHPQYLTFVVAGEEHAIGILRVREIIQFAGVTRVPRMPAWVRGVINLRGNVVPV